MKKQLLFGVMALLSGSLLGQVSTASDDLNWVNTTPGFTQDSPPILFCDNSSFNYTLTANDAGGFIGVNPDGVKFPIDPTTFTGNGYNYTITFNQSYSDIRIRFADLDFANGANPAEFVDFFTTGGATLPSSHQDVQGVLQFNTISANQRRLQPTTGFDSDAWVIWDQPTNQINFTYNRAGAGYGLIIDAVEVTEPHNTTASIMPVNHLGFMTLDSKHGPQLVARFCERDVIADGSASMNEDRYFLELNTMQLNTWQLGTTPIYSGWILNGQAPSAIDIINNAVSNSPTLTPGVVYAMTLATGLCWDSEMMLFVVEECCPEELILEIDCERGTVSIANLPNGITNLNTAWYQQQGNSSVHLGKYDGATSIPVTQFGTYTVVTSFTMPNGVECELVTTIEYNGRSCCEQLGAHLSHLDVPNSGTVTVNTIPYGNQVIPITNCRPGIRVAAECESGYYIGIEPFDPVAWQAIPGPTYSNHTNGTLGGGGNIVPINFSNLYAFVPNSFYLITIGLGDPGPPYDNFEYIVIRTNDCLYKAGTEFETIDQEESALDVSLAPNPATNATTIRLNQSKSGKISVLSLMGKTLSSIDFYEQQEVLITTEELPAGVYLIHVEIDGITTAKRFIKE